MITPSTEQIAADLLAGASIQDMIRACGSDAVEKAVSLLEARI